MMLFMRTTVTLDNDVERLIWETMHRSQKSFKKTLNDAVRQGLLSTKVQTETTQFVVKSRPMGLLPGIDRATLSDIDSDIEVEQFKKTTSRLMKLRK
jgi:hypothetical protein